MRKSEQQVNQGQTVTETPDGHRGTKQSPGRQTAKEAKLTETAALTSNTDIYPRR